MAELPHDSLTFSDVPICITGTGGPSQKPSHESPNLGEAFPSSKFEVQSLQTSVDLLALDVLDLVLDPYQRGFFQVELFPSAGFSDTMGFWSVLVVMDSQLSVVWTLITEAASPRQFF